MVRAASPPRWLLWVSFLGTPALWMVHFLLAYVLLEASCNLGGSAGFGRASLIVVTGLFIAGSLALTYLAFAVRKRAAASEAHYDDFLPRVGFIQGFLFTFAIVLEGAPMLFLNWCA